MAKKNSGKTEATKAAESTESTAAKPEKPAKVQQNGITRPKAGTATGKVWEIADALSKKLGRPAKRSEVMAEATSESNGINQATTATQYARWRKFFGITKAQVAEDKPAAVQAEGQVAETSTDVDEDEDEDDEDEDED